MKWYEILIDDEFVDYFSNDDNIFFVLENGNRVLAPTFSRYMDIVIGVIYAWTLPWVSVSKAAESMTKNPDIFRGFAFCREHQEFQDETHLSKLWNSIPVKTYESRYDIDIEALSAEQCAVLIIYPFCTRMGGSFEQPFQEDGRLKKYLLALKEKVEAER